MKPGLQNFGANRLDVVWIVALSVWLVASIWTLVVGNGDIFPRLGACLVGITALYFAMLPPLDPAPHGAIQLDETTSRRLNLLDRTVHLSLQNTAVVAGSVANSLEKSGIEVPTPLLELRKPVVNPSLPKNHQLDWDERDNLVAKAALEQKLARSKVLNTRQQIQRAQAWLIVVGTLQWGFGDLVGG